jgi:hypothetical protein
MDMHMVVCQQHGMHREMHDNKIKIVVFKSKTKYLKT